MMYASVAGGLSVYDFIKLYPNDEACMDLLFKAHYGDKPCAICEEKKFYRVNGRRSYACAKGHQVYPTKGTIMEGTQTPLHSWIWAVFFMLHSKNGMSALEIQRYLNVTYKTAFSIAHRIRSLMAEDRTEQFSGIVEIDESYFGGKKRATGEKKVGYNGRENKTIVFGMRQKRDGKIRLFIVPNTSGDDLLPLVKQHVEAGSTIYSDEHAPYKDLSKMGYQHYFVKHKKFQWMKRWVTTNRIESVWSYEKRAIRGTHIHVSRKYLQNYLNEHEFRYNNRKLPMKTQFEMLLKRLFSDQPKPYC